MGTLCLLGWAAGERVSSKLPSACAQNVPISTVWSVSELPFRVLPEAVCGRVGRGGRVGQQ